MSSYILSVDWFLSNCIAELLLRARNFSLTQDKLQAVIFVASCLYSWYLTYAPWISRNILVAHNGKSRDLKDKKIAKLLKTKIWMEIVFEYKIVTSSIYLSQDDYVYSLTDVFKQVIEAQSKNLSVLLGQ